MKILMVAMPNLHFFRWTQQLSDAGHEIIWFDVNDGGKNVDRLTGVHQIVGWKLRWDFPGRSYIKKKAPKIYHYIQLINERKTATVFEKKLKEIKPDIVHSFALYIACAPILSVMNNYPTIKWIFSSWGSDLYDLQNYPSDLNHIIKVLARVNYLMVDCKRDYVIAQKHGFSNHFLGVFPGGGGYNLEYLQSKIVPIGAKKTILIKGFQGRWGRCVSVLKALEPLQTILADYSIVIFGADQEVFSFIEISAFGKWNNLAVKGKISQDEVFCLMGKSILYIGNSISDGMPNTLLEAISLQVFPIQSNPGGATAELIIDGLNGLLINEPENTEHISDIILRALSNFEMIKKGIAYNTLNLTSSFESRALKEKVVMCYDRVLQDNF